MPAFVKAEPPQTSGKRKVSRGARPFDIQSTVCAGKCQAAVSRLPKKFEKRIVYRAPACYNKKLSWQCRNPKKAHECFCFNGFGAYYVTICTQFIFPPSEWVFINVSDLRRPSASNIAVTKRPLPYWFVEWEQEVPLDHFNLFDDRTSLKCWYNIDTVGAGLNQLDGIWFLSYPDSEAQKVPQFMGRGFFPLPMNWGCSQTRFGFCK